MCESRGPNLPSTVYAHSTLAFCLCLFPRRSSWVQQKPLSTGSTGCLHNLLMQSKTQCLESGSIFNVPPQLTLKNWDPEQNWEIRTGDYNMSWRTLIFDAFKEKKNWRIAGGQNLLLGFNCTKWQQPLKNEKPKEIQETIVQIVQLCISPRYSEMNKSYLRKTQQCTRT